MLDSRQQIDLRERQKAHLIKANSGEWESIFVRIGSNRIELERFPCRLSVVEKSGLIEAQLTYLSSGKVARSAFRDIPDSMQIQAAGHWSLAPQFLTQEFWTTEFCLCGPHERRRSVVRQRRDGLESLVVIVEWRAGMRVPLSCLGGKDPSALSNPGATPPRPLQSWARASHLAWGSRFPIPLKSNQPPGVGTQRPSPGDTAQIVNSYGNR